METEKKIAYAIERLTDTYKSLFWEKAKVVGLSPIQIQILLYIKRNPTTEIGVSNLALNFQVTKPTISDAMRVLVKKELLFKDFSVADARRFNLGLTPKGEDISIDLEKYAQPLEQSINKLNINELEGLYDGLSQLIYRLHQKKVISVQKMCFSCDYYAQQKGGHFCKLMQLPLQKVEIRLNCSDYKNSTNT